MVVALDGVDVIRAVRVLRDHFDNADVVEAVILVPFDIDEVALLRDIRPVRDGNAVAQIELAFLAAQTAVHRDISAPLLIPHRATLAAGLQGIIAAKHGRAIVFVGEIHAPGNELRAPFAVGAAAPLAVFAVTALCRGIAQLVDGRRDEHICAVIRQRARAEQQNQSQQQGDDVLHEKPPIGYVGVMSGLCPNPRQEPEVLGFPTYKFKNYKREAKKGVRGIYSLRQVRAEARRNPRRLNLKKKQFQSAAASQTHFHHIYE